MYISRCLFYCVLKVTRHFRQIYFLTVSLLESQALFFLVLLILNGFVHLVEADPAGCRLSLLSSLSLFFSVCVC